MGTTAKRAAVATLVAGGILVLALALWKVKVVIALFFLGMIIAAAMRPGIDWLQRHARIPRGLGVLIHFAALAGLVALFLWLIVPPAISQVQQAIGGSALHHEAVHSSGFNNVTSPAALHVVRFGGASPKSRLTACVSLRSPTGVEVACTLR